MKRGDIAEVGPHKILCGDCREASEALTLFGAHPLMPAATVIFSPPYLQRRHYGNTPDGTGADLFISALRNMVHTHDVQVFAVVGHLHSDGGQDLFYEEWLNAAREGGWRRFSTYVWDKQNGLPGKWHGRLAPSHEWIFHLNRQARMPRKFLDTKWGKGRYHRRYAWKNSKICGDAAKSKDHTIHDYKIDDSVIRLSPAGKSIGLKHPAPFPWQLPHRLLLSYGAPGGVVYDPMLGSGSTIIAAHEAGLVGYGCEINPDYCDLAVERIRKHMEKKR